VVRKLMEASDKAIDVMPPDALEISALATEIADKLEPANYPSDTVMKLRGNAWRDRGYCLFYVGDHNAAMRAANEALDCLRRCACDEFDSARVYLVIAQLSRQSEVGSAYTWLRQARTTFLNTGDRSRAESTQSIEATLAANAGDFRRALQLTVAALERGGILMSPQVRAALTSNVGYYCRELGRVKEALEAFTLAQFMFSELNMSGEVIRHRWNVAVLLLEQGNFAAAKVRLQNVIDDFSAIGMHGPAAAASLDLAEVYLSEQRFGEVAQLCSDAMRHFERTGLSYAPRALRALSFLRETSQNEKTTSELLHDIKVYLKRLPSEPNVLFVPPPN